MCRAEITVGGVEIDHLDLALYRFGQALAQDTEVTTSTPPQLTRSTYTIKRIAELAGIEVDTLLERHIKQCDLDLYVMVPATVTVYSLVKNYLALKPVGVLSQVPYPELVMPQSHPEIEAVRLSREDCRKLVAYGKVEQMCFGAGLAAIEGRVDGTREQDELEVVLLRDWHFIPGQLEHADAYFGFGKIMSEWSLDALKKGVSFRLHPDHVEGGGPSDICLLGRPGRPLHQKYEYWFGLYPNPPARAPIADRLTGISVPMVLSIAEEDVLAIRDDVVQFLERFGYPVSLSAASEESDNSVVGIPASRAPSKIENSGVGWPASIPESFASYSCRDLLTLDSSGDIHVVPFKDAPKALKVLFFIREKTWAKDWKKTKGLPMVELNKYNAEVVISQLIEGAQNEGISLSQAKAKIMTYFIRPVWARSSVPGHEKKEWSSTYETPEFMQLISSARRVLEWKNEHGGDPTGPIIDEFLAKRDPMPMSENRLDEARSLVRYASGKVGRPAKR